MPRISIRHAKLDELPRIIFITRLAYKIPYKKDTLVTVSHEPKDVKYQFAKNDFSIIAAILNGRIVGSVRYKFVDTNSLYFYKLAVLKMHRNKGIGSLLVKEVQKVARKKDCDTVLLECAQEKHLVDYYKHFGFKVDEIKKHLDHHDVYMSKQITNKGT
jgi:predicted N-acetyltransferase YhbS